MNRIICSDALEALRSLPDAIIQTCVTSPPYYGLRDYGVGGQIGLEEAPEAFTQKLVGVFREVRRVLKGDGTLWLNIGDSYSSGVGNSTTNQSLRGGNEYGVARPPGIEGMKPKDLIGIPWRVAFALQADGWYLRQDIIWHKPNPVPESVTDRCTKAHEYIFLLSKSEQYYYDADAIREAYTEEQLATGMAAARREGYDGGSYSDWYHNKRQGSDWVNKKETGDHLTYGQAKKLAGTKPPNLLHPSGKNKRSVWTVTTKPYRGAHFATFPPDLIEPCILAGARPYDIVLDPFAGSGTTLAVAKRFGRRYLGIELNPDYLKLAEERIRALPECLPFISARRETGNARV
jgi:DNA modification methylase